MTTPETAVPAEQEAPAGGHPYEFPPAQPLRLAGHVGGRIISERPEWAYLADPPAPDPTEAVLAEWRAALVRNLPVRRVAVAEPEPEPAVPAPAPVVPPSARLAALPEPAPTPAHAGSRRPLFGRRRHDGQPSAHEFAVPPERDNAGIWPRPGQDGPGPDSQDENGGDRAGLAGREGSTSPPLPGPSAMPVPMKSGTVPPQAEGVMPDGPRWNAQGRSGSPENVPRPAPAQRGETPEAGTVSDGPGRQDARPETAQDEGRAFGGLNNAQQDRAAIAADADDDKAAAVQHAAEEALRRAGAKQEDLDALAKPGDGRDATSEMTAILPVPEQGERDA